MLNKYFTFKCLNLVLLIFIAFETVYYNVMYDIFLVLLLCILSVAAGSFFKIKLNLIDRYFIRFALGLGTVGFGIWLLTFHNPNYRSLFFLFSAVLIAVRYKSLIRYVKNIKRYSKHIEIKNRFFFPLLLVAIIAYVPASAHPVYMYDALAKHIAIPFQILNNIHWDYNVVEYIGYGDYAILTHMYYLYLMALGGTKALVIFNTTVTFLILFLLLRISTHVYKSTFVVNSILLLFLTTPMFTWVTTSLFIDFFPVFFIFTALLLLINYKTYRNILIISFVLGLSMFTKQMAFYYVLPMALYLLVDFIYAVIKKRRKLQISTVILALCAFFISFTPSLLIIWHKTGNPLFPFMNSIFKSIYFDTGNFNDPFNKNPLGLNLRSLFSMVFHTSKNIEMRDGALGSYLLLTPVIPVILFIRKHSLLVKLFALTMSSYLISLLFTYNIRYMLGVLVLFVLLSVFAIDILLKSNTARLLKTCLILLIAAPNLYFIQHLRGTSDFSLHTYSTGYIIAFLTLFIMIFLSLQIYLKHFNVGLIKAGLILILVIPNLYYLYCYKWWSLQSNELFAIIPNESVLQAVNEKEIRVLSNNDVFRGVFKGEFYTLDWYNAYFVNKIRKEEISPQDFLRCFDYYLIEKALPESRMFNSDIFSLENKDVSAVLTKYKESETHTLYKVNKSYDEVLAQQFTPPVTFNQDLPVPLSWERKNRTYKFEVDVQSSEMSNNRVRMTVLWNDSTGKTIGRTFIYFKTDKDRKIYKTEEITKIPQRALSANWFLTSEDQKPVTLYSVKILGAEQTVLDQELLNYNRKWPYLTDWNPLSSTQ